MLIGNNQQCKDYVRRSLRHFDVMIDGEVGIDDDLEGNSIFDLVYDEITEKQLVMIAVDSIEGVQKCLKAISVTKLKIIYTGYEPVLVGHEEMVLDVHMGFNTPKSIQVIKTNSDSDLERICCWNFRRLNFRN